MIWTIFTVFMVYGTGSAYCFAAANDEREGRPLSAMLKFSMLWPLMVPVLLFLLARLLWREMR